MFYQSVVETFQRMSYAYCCGRCGDRRGSRICSAGWGVDMIQGYYFSRPLPAEELLKFF